MPARRNKKPNVRELVVNSQFHLQVRIVVASVLIAPCNSAFAQGNYSEVTAEDVVALQLNHYFTPDKKGHQPDFDWSFTKDEFVVKSAAGAIPADLVQRLMPAETKATEIRGQWKLAREGGVQLVLTKIVGTDQAGEEVLGLKEAKFRIYRTAPTVIRIGEPQYVFGLSQ
jgi:hypothetical protein